MLVEQVDDIGLEALERGLGDLLDVVRAAVEAAPTRSTIGIRLEAEFGSDDDLVAKGSEGFAHEFLVGERTVDFGGIEKCDAAFDGGSDKRDHLFFVGGRAVAKAHAHAAEAEGRNFKVAIAEFALVHCFSSAANSAD